MSSFHSVLYLFCTLEESHCCGSWSVQVERPSNTATHSSIHSISIRIIRFDSYLAQQTAPPSHDLVIYFCSDCFAVAALLHVARSAARYLNDRFDPTWGKSRAPQLTLAVQAKHWCVFVPYMCAHTQLCHTLSFTHNFHTQLSHTPSFTHNFVTHHVPLTHSIFHIQLCHTQLFLLVDPSTPPLSFLPSPSRYNICCSLLEEVDLRGFAVL